jgi:branched-chain amino acid transport system permease protein
MELGTLFGFIIKMGALIAWIFGLLWVLNRKQLWLKILGVLAAFGIVQFAIVLKIGEFSPFTGFDQVLLIQACTMSMVCLGLNLIYGFNGQFSLAQWGFYGIGAYCAADITYRWAIGDASGLLVVGFGVILGGLTLFGVNRLLKLKRGIPVLSAFTFYLIATIGAGIVAVLLGKYLAPLFAPGFGTADAPGPLAGPAAQQIVFFLSVILAGAFAAGVSFLFGLPVLTLGSDYFGIATLGFAIVIQTLMSNSDTILPFPEMKGGRGMIGIPKLTNWIWVFFFFLLVVIMIRNLIRSSTGRAVMSVREDETAAKAMGINVANTKLLAFVAGSLFAGLGGAVYAHYIGFLSPGTFSFIAGFNPLIVVVFGGLGSMTGTIVAAFGWYFFLEGFLRIVLGYMGTEAPTWRYVFYPIALLLLMLLRPQGLLGTVEWGFLKVTGVFRKGVSDQKGESMQSGGSPESAGSAPDMKSFSAQIGTAPSWSVPDPADEENYVRSCAEMAFTEKAEERTFRSDPAFQRVLDPLNSKQYGTAIQTAESLLQRFEDFDLPYKWLASACRSTDDLKRSQQVLAEGLSKAKRKSILLTDMGETEWRMGNIHEAVYFWCQALHCLSSNPIDYNAFLLLSCVASGCGLRDVEHMLLDRVDAIRGGQVRLDPTVADRLTSLARSKKSPAMCNAILAIGTKYLQTA